MAQISFPNQQSGPEPRFRLVSFMLLVREQVAQLWESNNMFSPLQLASASTAARRPLLLLKVALMVCTAAISSSAFARTTTTTSLAVTSSGVVVTSVKAGSLVTLTASVEAGTTAVKQGQVNFCDAMAAYCTDIHILATAQLTSSGTATYKFRPGIGSHSYKAVFVGTNSYAGSVSSASPLKVTGTVGPFATATSIAETGAWGDYTLTGTVTEAGGTVAPTGTVSFLDASNGNSVLAVGSLGTAVAGIGWPNPKSLLNTQGTYFVLVVDLNGDGIPDLVLGSNVVSIYLGNTKGTYTKAATPSIQGPTSYPIVSADFNGDGIPDLAVPLYGSNEIAILLGKGNGTFATPIMAYVPGSIVDIAQVVVGDFNGDGIPDLAVIDSDNSVVDILLGNGDGTFTAETANPPISGTPSHLATGDFNGDGNTDLAVAENAGTVAILLGNGDGTFAASGSVNSGTSAPPIAVADFNGDGKLDIAVPAGTGTNELVTVLTGNGDGTFHSPFSGSPTSTSVTWIQVADFNQDGTPDVVLADSGGSATVFLNNGSGSVSKSFPVVSGLNVPYYLEVGVGDLNGDGYPDIVAGGYYSSAQGLYLTEPTETASASASVQVNGVGRHLAEASFPAEGNYESSVSSSIPLWGLLPATSTTLSLTSGGSPVTSVTPGTVVLLTAQVSVGATPVTAGQVNFCDASAPHCTDIHILASSALNSSGTATFEFVPGAGTHSYQAQFVEDGFGLPSASNIASLTVGPPPSPVYSDTAAISFNGSQGDYSLTATVMGYGGPASPTGNVSFVDTSFGNDVLATAALGAVAAGNGWLISQTPPTGSNPVSEVTEDFNGDGIPDLAVIWSNSIYGGPFSVTILFGKGDGTFTTGPTVQPAGVQLYPTMIGGDFNGDGKGDLAVLSYNGSSISYITVLLGKGDGTFATPITGQVYSQPQTGGDVIIGTLAAADFNGDGKLDLAVVGDYVSSGGVTILLGNGDGSFTAAGPNLDLTADFALIATGDFNGDGIPDFVTPNYFEFGGSPTIFLGKGDGTFTFSKVTFTLDYFPTSVLVADFNGDGVLDLAFSDLNGVEIALGNGDGTFTETAASPIPVPSELYSLKVGDFNHDGKVDIAGIDNYNDRIVLLIGAGDGTFTVTATTPAVSQIFLGPFAIVAADFNSDGVPDLAMLTKNVNTASTLLTVPTETATVTVNGIAPAAPGTHYVDASYAGDRNYGAVTSGTIPLIGGLPPVRVSPNSLSFGNEVINTTSVAKTVTLTNTGTAALNISSITTSGDFGVFSKTCGSTLAGGAKCTVKVTFTPTVLGKLTGALTFTDNAPNSPQTVGLSGTGVLPATLAPATATYAWQAVGTTSAAKTFTLTNNQTVALTSIAITTAGDFAVSATTCTTSLIAKGKCTISVTFTPTAKGTRTGVLSVSDSANNSPQKSSLTGTGK
jgi:FG-GAP-like repeat/Bacterial Ig-like domain (group 3)/Abnormal spindle-like microcephaly-assoc'd, ASPM-SPD-2-Hydin